jgi:hypothetical protein
MAGVSVLSPTGQSTVQHFSWPKIADEIAKKGFAFVIWSVILGHGKCFPESHGATSVKLNHLIS